MNYISYSSLIEEFQTRLDRFSKFWDFWEEEKIKNKYLPELDMQGDERILYDNLLSEYEKKTKEPLSFNFSKDQNAEYRRTCYAHGEFVIGLFLEKLGLKFETEIGKDRILGVNPGNDLDEYSIVSPFDFYIPKLKLIIEVDGINYHIVSLCRDPICCTCKVDKKNKRYPPPENIKKHIRKYYHKDNLAKELGCNLIRIISLDIFNLRNGNNIILNDAFYVFFTEILEPFLNNNEFSAKKEIKENINKFSTLYHEEAIKLNKRGIIVTAKKKENFGFIQSNNLEEKDYFFSFRDYIGSNPKKGSNVLFNEGYNSEGICAIKVREI